MNVTTHDSAYFAAQLEPYRPELRAHCYRMLGSTQDAEDMVQETFLRAWRGRNNFEGRAALRTWLYSIATNACLDHLKKAKRRTLPQIQRAASGENETLAPPILEPIWLQPYPDEWMATEKNVNVEQRFAEREYITLAFIAVLQLLPPRQRAILLLRDVLDWKAREVANLLNTTESAVKSALHRARATLANQQDELAESQPIAELDTADQQLLNDYVEAWENADVEALLNLLTTDATFSMPPIPSWLRGHRGDWRTLCATNSSSAATAIYKGGCNPQKPMDNQHLDSISAPMMAHIKHMAFKCSRFGMERFWRSSPSKTPTCSSISG